MVRIAEVEEFIKNLDRGTTFTALDLKKMMNLDDVTVADLGSALRKLAKYDFVKTIDFKKVKSHTFRVWEVQ